MTIEKWTAIIQAVAAVAALLLSGIAIYLGIRALRLSSSSLQQVSRQIDLAEAETFGSFPNVVEISGISFGAESGLLVVVSDLAPEPRRSLIRNVELVRQDGSTWAEPKYPWLIVDLADDEFRLDRPLDSATIPRLADDRGIAVFFPLPIALANELSPGDWGPIMGSSKRLPDSVHVRISWEDVRGAHQHLAPRRAIKYKPAD